MVCVEREEGFEMMTYAERMKELMEMMKEICEETPVPECKNCPMKNFCKHIHNGNSKWADRSIGDWD